MSNRALRVKTKVVSSVVVLTNVLGNFSLSWGIKQSVVAISLSPLVLLKTMLSPWVLVGIGLLILWVLSRITLLSWADLSYVLPVTSIGYVLTAFMGKYFLAEQISWQRWAGTLLIVAGTALVGTTHPRTTKAPARMKGAS
jgi:uncharacterized membrane protein